MQRTISSIFFAVTLLGGAASLAAQGVHPQLRHLYAEINRLAKLPKPPRTKLDDLVLANLRQLYLDMVGSKSLLQGFTFDRDKGAKTDPPKTTPEGAGIWKAGETKGYRISIYFEWAYRFFGKKWTEEDCDPQPTVDQLLKLGTMITLGNMFHEMVHIVYNDGTCPMVEVTDKKGRKKKVEDPKCRAKRECETGRIAAYYFDMVARLDPEIPIVRPTDKCTIGYWFWAYADSTNTYIREACKKAGL